MKEVYLNEQDDMEWLHRVHGIKACAAIVFGNEDAPLAVQAFHVRAPKWTDKGVWYRPGQDGKLQRTGE